MALSFAFRLPQIQDAKLIEVVEGFLVTRIVRPASGDCFSTPNAAVVKKKSVFIMVCRGRVS